MAEEQPHREGGQVFKQVRLTEKPVKGYTSAQKELVPLASKLEGASEQA
ncbi:MAG: hypothetical protein J2P50_11090 [Hyphomicrobiaceae bacterium]|nr:hypothetical protein [Hyphomicrobiaceae bacterium]